MRPPVVLLLFMVLLLVEGVLLGMKVERDRSDPAWALDDLSDECVTEWRQTDDSHRIVYMDGELCWVKLRKVKVRR